VLVAAAGVDSVHIHQVGAASEAITCCDVAAVVSTDTLITWTGVYLLTVCVRCMRGVTTTMASRAVERRQSIVSRRWFRVLTATRSQGWRVAPHTALRGVPRTLHRQSCMNRCCSLPPKIRLALDTWVSSYSPQNSLNYRDNA